MPKREINKVLMICYNYPPAYNSGTERSAKFAEYLPAYDWTPLVVTIEDEGIGGRREGDVLRAADPLKTFLRRLYHGKEFRKIDREWQKGIVQPDTLAKRLKRTMARLADKWLLIPDRWISWSISAFWPALSLIRAEGVKVIYSTSPPASSHLLGLALKLAAGKPWVMDLRDPWTIEPVRDFLRKPGLRLEIEKRIERLCFERADAIILNTPEVERRYRGIYPRCADKMQIIPNGFDSREITEASAGLGNPTPWSTVGEDTFVISHAGRFFRTNQEEQTPHALLNALSELRREKIISGENCRVILAGPLHPTTASRISELGLGDLIDAAGVITHFDCLRLMMASDLLLLFDPADDGETYVRSKLYEYLGSGRRILGLVPAGASRELLESSEQGLLTHPEDEEGIKESIRTAIELRGEPVPNAEIDLMRYERSKLTGELTLILDEVGVKNRPSRASV